VSINPDVRGDTTFTWLHGTTSDFRTGADRFTLQGGWPATRDYDGLSAVNSTVRITHRYAADSTIAEGAVVMNKNAAQKWHTVMMSFNWSDIRDLFGVPAPEPALPPAENVLMSKILSGVLPAPCQHSLTPTDGEPAPPARGVPAASVLHQNVPNPVNPTTTIAFDLAQPGPVQLRVFDVAGRLVRTLVTGRRAAGPHAVTWNGLDDRGARVASGLYFYALHAGGEVVTRRMVLLE
jgi:hypothetical protein